MTHGGNFPSVPAPHLRASLSSCLAVYIVCITSKERCVPRGLRAPCIPCKPGRYNVQTKYRRVCKGMFFGRTPQVLPMKPSLCVAHLPKATQPGFPEFSPLGLISAMFVQVPWLQVSSFKMYSGLLSGARGRKVGTVIEKTDTSVNSREFGCAF